MSKIKAFFQDHPLALGASVLSGLLRVVQTLNFAPVGALSIYSGARMKGIAAWIVPALVMVITDWILGFSRYGLVRGLQPLYSYTAPCSSTSASAVCSPTQRTLPW